MVTELLQVHKRTSTRKTSKSILQSQIQHIERTTVYWIYSIVDRQLLLLMGLTSDCFATEAQQTIANGYQVKKEGIFGFKVWIRKDGA